MINSATRILLVDDFDLVRTMLRQVLSQLNIENVDDASDGIEAIHKIEEAHEEKNPYGAIFLDWNMPKRTGLEVIKYCRDKDEFKDLIIIMITAEAEKAYVLKALTSGATDYIVKPCSLQTMQSKIENINSKLAKKAG